MIMTEPNRVVRAVNWLDVADLMRKCVRGHGYVPTAEEQRLLEDAMHSDPSRYRWMHAEIKKEAGRQMTGGTP